MEDSFADRFSRHKDRRISEMRQRWRDSKSHYKRKYRTWIVDLKVSLTSVKDRFLRYVLSIILELFIITLFK